MKIKNNQIKILLSSIIGIELDPIQSSARRRIIRTLSEYDEDIKFLRTELIEKYATKKGDKYEKDINGGYKFTIKNLKKYRVDFNKILDQEIDIKIDETNKKDWQTIKDILKDILKQNKSDKMSANDFEIYESLSEILELIK